MKQFKNLILAGALVLGLAGFAVSCDKYGDDIDELTSRVGKLETQLTDLQTKIDAGVIVTGVTQTAGGVTIQTSNGTYTITNGEKGEKGEKGDKGDQGQGSVVTLGDNGNWFIDGVDTGISYKGEKGDKGDKGDQGDKGDKGDASVVEIGENGHWFIDGVDTGVKAGADGALSAVWDPIAGTLTLKNVEGYEGDYVLNLRTGVTSVELVYSYSKQEDPHAHKALTFITAEEKDNVFGKDVVSNPLTFTKGNQYFVPQTFTVRVSPTNVVLTPEMITLVNSKGESLDFIEVVDVEKYDKLLTKAAGENGLWNVTVSLTSYDKKTFDAATKVKDENVLFAVKVNNAAGTAGQENYDVVSTYDLTVAYDAYKPETTLEYYVDDTPIAEVNNRYDENSVSFIPTPNAAQDYEELKWNAKVPAVAPVKEGTNKNVEQDTDVPPTGDNRSAQPVYPAVQGTPITIGLYDEDGEPYTNIRAFYVVLDKQNAVESTPSELNAWESYEYEGLGVVVEGPEATITIDSEKAINDIIGFRVYAVNYDGTLVDPDGKAFYVQLGTESVTWDAVATTIVPESESTADITSDTVSVTATKLTGAATYEWVTDKISGHESPIFYADFCDANGNSLLNANSKGGSATGVKDFSKIAKVYTVPASGINWNEYEDNKAYTGTLTVKSATGHVLATIKVTFTKKLPTAAPAGFSVKTNQLADGTTWNAYLIPVVAAGDDPNAKASWGNATAKYGAMNLDYLFNFAGDVDKYTITFADAKTDAGKVVDNDAEHVAGSPVVQRLSVEAEYIDNETSHETTVEYNYGKISSKKNADGTYPDYKVEAIAPFETVFHEIYDDTYTWRWSKANDQVGSTKVAEAPTTTVEYGAGSGEPGAAAKFTLDLTTAIIGESTHDKIYNAFFSPSYEKSIDLTKVTATLTSDGTDKVEYFDVEVNASDKKLEFKHKSGATNPTANVPSTLTITYTDQYAVGDAEEVHIHSFTLKMTVKKR